MVKAIEKLFAWLSCRGQIRKGRCRFVVRASRLHALGIVRICRRGRLPFDKLTALSEAEGHHNCPL